ncbi:MAG: choice-of-anchor D domain-containing protein [Candidatus Cloacimonetes bacterium]|nr:choice-of-anchor D domain-containing protein [Candidatus Cloacimonadota bacterium]MCF7813121.1 choice-of-anchor D domain-containing protein [Candidatus Cloacimonadota bacterium]MCF7867569.1 choice-of-anchor D domain-containing protein [Candidatus Cloacimonadota bacterium]MCF7883037.1 choice-of-anchor D domain-containing protein [Candidatus Cloacimonadota bacterium]
MKKLLLICFLMSFAIIFAGTIELGFSGTKVEVLRSDDFGLNLNYKLSRINSFTVNSDEGDFDQIAIPEGTYSTRIGEPRLPIIRKLIAVPIGAEVRISAADFEETEYILAEFGIDNSIIPAQPPLPKSADPSKIEFIYEAANYNSNSYNSDPLVSVEEIGSMRGVRIFAVIVEPVKYNPVRGSIRVYNNIDVNVEFINSNIAATNYLREKAYSHYFQNLFNSTLLNSNSINYRDNITQYPVKYVIVSDPMFETQLQPFIEWKIQKGFDVIEAYTDEPNVGTSPTSIHNYLQGLYDAATPDDPAPSFVLFVGDVQQIPAWSGSTGSHVTDLNYVKLDGPDIVPDMYYGRFSAQTTAQLQPQIDKTLMYEKFDMPDPSYLGEVVMIAGMDSSHGSTWGNGQINYGTENYFNLAHGITSHTYLYPSSGSSSSQIVQNVSDGVGYINYTAHGSSTSWSDPSFTIANINSLQNSGEYCLAVGNCCLTNKFEVGTCFGEAWLRAEDKGAIGYIGGTNSTYWDEDYWWGVGAGTVTANPTYATTGLGVYDGLFHDNGEPFEDWYTTTAGMIYRGNLSVTEGGGMINYYWEIYAIMGDPSLEVYLGVPAENMVSYPDVIFLGLDEIQVSAEPYSYVSLSLDGVIHGTVLVDETGVATLGFDAFTNPGMADIVISRQNKIPVIAQIEVIPSGGPYVVVESFEITDDNNNIPEYNETIGLDMSFENVGTDNATNVTATLSTTDTYVNITGSTTNIGDITTGTIVEILDAFEIEVADDIPDQHIAMFNVEITGSSTWGSTINITFNAPAFDVGPYVIDDNGGNGLLDPGETATVSIPITNAGNALSPDMIAELTNASPDVITLLVDTVNIPAVNIGEEVWADFEVEVADDAQPGTIATLGFAANAGEYNASETLNLPIGLVFEDFETGDFSMFDWQMGTYGWEVTNLNPYEGVYSAKSQTISHNQNAELTLVLDIPADDEISFFRKVSSEDNYDYLRFYINGTLKEEWAGEESWSEVTYAVTAGDDTEFKWSYEKDYSVSSGSDCAWIDYIVFPGIGGTATPIINVNITEIAFGDVNVGETVIEDFTLQNLGTAELTGTILTPDGFTVTLPTRNEENFTIPPNEDITVEIEFAPTQGMLYDGNIEISSNDPNQALIEIPVSGTGVATGTNDLIPLVTELYGNHPNPFNPTTNISYGLNQNSDVKLVIFNTKGQKVKILVNEVQQAGYYNLTWNGKDDNNKQVTSGVYFYELFVGETDYTSVKKMLLLK